MASILKDNAGSRYRNHVRTLNLISIIICKKQFRQSLIKSNVNISRISCRTVDECKLLKINVVLNFGNWKITLEQ